MPGPAPRIEAGNSKMWWEMRRIPLKTIGVASFAMVAVTGLATGIYWQSTTKLPSPPALDALVTTPGVVVSLEPDLLVFEPASGRASAGMVFYPGGGVDFRAYAPVLHQIAERGFLVAVPRMPLHLAFLRIRAADEVIARFPDVDPWAIAGHSLGGVAAATYASSHPGLAGLVLWASYPADDSLRESPLRVLSIFGSADGLTTAQDIEQSRELLPLSTQFVEIPGGNHAQFGSYGSQSGDHPTDLPPEAQWTEVADVTAEFLESLSR